MYQSDLDFYDLNCELGSKTAKQGIPPFTMQHYSL